MTDVMPGKMLALVREELTLTQEYYCDAGIHVGKYRVVLEGYVTSEQLVLLRGE